MEDYETVILPEVPGRGADDYVLPFQLEGAGARGRLIRLGQAADTILSQHAYPEAVSALLGEAVTLTAMLGSSLKFDGKFILQTKSDGPVSFLVVHYNAPGGLRGYASFDAGELRRTEAWRGAHRPGLLGQGHLAMTIDPGGEMECYQAVVPLEGVSLTDAAHLYFRQSEQIPTFIKIAVARHFTRGAGDREGSWTWRAGGLMVQKLTSEGGTLEVSGKADDQDAGSGEGWRRARILAATVEDHELLDPALAPERLLYRLFHQEQVRAFRATALEARCQCSRAGIEQFLSRFSPDERRDMTEQGKITVKCEFCNRSYNFDAAALSTQGPDN